MPVIQHHFALLLRDGSCQMPRVDCVMGLPGAVRVERAIANSALGGPIMFRRNNHPGLPLSWGIQGDPLQDSEAYIFVQPGANGFLPV